MKVSASLLSCRDRLKEVTKELNNLDVDYIHLDIMDGEFVSNTSFTYDEIKEIVNTTNKPLDVHLMVKDIDKYIYNYAMLNTEYITFHYEAMKDIRIIDKVKNYGVKVGISVNPETNIEQIYDLLDKIDLVLIMSVHPGRGGQAFIPETIEKIEKLRKKIDNDKLDVLISVDGGINNSSSKLCHNADILVIGSALTNSDNMKEFIESVK